MKNYLKNFGPTRFLIYQNEPAYNLCPVLPPSPKSSPLTDKRKGASDNVLKGQFKALQITYWPVPRSEAIFKK